MRWIRNLLLWWQRVRKPLSLGRRGEREAQRYLQSRGYRIVDRALRNRSGELDLVAVTGRTVVFVEVKTRTSHEAGSPAEAVDRNKQQRILRAAREYVHRHTLHDCQLRFDVIAITWPGQKRPVIEHIEHAFTMGE